MFSIDNEYIPIIKENRNKHKIGKKILIFIYITIIILIKTIKIINEIIKF